jgi:hypothetical protein
VSVQCSTAAHSAAEVKKDGEQIWNWKKAFVELDKLSSERKVRFVAL